jgi:glycogen(starch) synthase
VHKRQGPDAESPDPIGQGPIGPDRTEADRLRVAVLTRGVRPLHGVGGLERHVFDLVRHLAARGVEITLITRPPLPGCATDGDPFPPVLTPGAAVDRPAPVRVVTVPYVTFPGAGGRGTTVVDRSTAYPLFGWRAGRVAVRLVRQGTIDLVHALGASGLGYALARRRHEDTVPFVLNPQGLEEFGSTNPNAARLKRLAYTPLQTAVRASARGADAVIATDRGFVSTVLHHLPVDEAKVHVVPNAVDLDEIDRARTTNAAATLRARLQLEADERLLLSVGRIEANKGFHVLARALGLLAERETSRGVRRRWRWVLVGDGPFRPSVEREAAEAGIASRIIMPGRASDAELSSWYAAADLFVHPTLYEGSSLVTLEAMAHGRPVVATRAGGLPDKVLPGITGWLVEPGRPDLLAAALDEALDRFPALTEVGHAGRLLVEREFSWTATADRLITLYRALAGMRPTS